MPSTPEPAKFEAAAYEDRVPRGVAPRILIEHVRNTVPYIFIDDAAGSELHPVQLLCQTAQTPEAPLSHVQYFELCLSAHFATVASLVPTDVDNQIRFRLWHPALETSEILAMTGHVMEFPRWDSRKVSRRWVASPRTGEVLSGHGGEWFSVAVAAYGALKRRAPKSAAEIAAEILREMGREAAVYDDLKRAGDGIGLLKAATLIAHNLGDLDRVIEMWNLSENDAFREAAFKAGHAAHGAALSARPSLQEAGSLNKAYMAIENHRHFALRAARGLRKSPDFLVPIGPFFDDWGKTVATHPALSLRELAEVAEALVDGWHHLNKQLTQRPEDSRGRIAVGYARALTGISEGFPGGMNRLATELPARVARALRAGPLRQAIDVPRRRFEDQWSHCALRARCPF